MKEGNVYVFFFQAEDGIRDVAVTGVQTCALPIHKFLNSSEVAKLAGIHRLTLLRWIREGKMRDVSRDRNGWRIFTEAEAADVIAFATSVNQRTSPAQTVLFRHRISADQLVSSTL